MEQAPSDTFESLAEAIVSLCGSIHGAEYRLIELIRRMEALRPWNRERPDCAHWLNVTCGMDLVTAREKVRIAHALDDLPQITAAFRDGELSYSKVRAITRIATWDTEDELIELAQATTAEHVAKLVRARRQADHLSVPGAALNAWTHRHLDYHVASDGSVVFEGRLPAEMGAMLLKALERAAEWLQAEDQAEPWRAFADKVPDEAVAEKQQAPMRRADALAVLAERFLARVPEADEALATADRYLITIHAPAEALPEHAAIDAEDPPQFEDGTVVAPETVRRLCCDAAVVRILESGDGEPLDLARLSHRFTAADADLPENPALRSVRALDVLSSTPARPNCRAPCLSRHLHALASRIGEISGLGRKTRVIPPSMRRALKRRDGGCRFPGCTHTRFVDGHHIIHWADGGATCLDNLVSLCRFHHRLLHEGGYYVVKDGQAFRFFRSDGFEIRGFEEAMQRVFTMAARERLEQARLGVRVPMGYSSAPLRGVGGTAAQPP